MNRLHVPRYDHTIHVSVYQLHKLHHKPATLLGYMNIGTDHETDISTGHMVSTLVIMQYCQFTFEGKINVNDSQCMFYIL